MSKRKILLLGNGIAKNEGGLSWDQIIMKMAQKNNPRCHLATENGSKNSSLPMPLQAVVASNNRIDSYLKDNHKKFYGSINNIENKSIIRRLLVAGFDDIITTNYSYEIEIASTDKATISDYYLDKIRKTTEKNKKAEGKYFIHTFNEIEYMGIKNRIWHIHGVAKNPDSMVIGHYYYGMLMSKYAEYLKKVGNNYQINPDKNDSWLDGFILGDVYILGFGLEPSEFDLWWLIERKNREKNCSQGKIFYYTPQWEYEKDYEKFSLMKSCGIIIENQTTKKDKDYQEYYEKAVSSIISRI